ncbi:GAF domain-containing protein [Cognatilysobacter segetis]|uniref:GAF domain-containing protein n=1 Tax=Cognatilysobacter segetis TaxID=2492394 RepID=UPI00105E7D4B|nr:GAF domain-containing protein [Lysobacter segetis]
MESVQSACEQARQRIDDDAPLDEILNGLVNAAETIAGDGSVASVLILDDDGLLRNGASPNLPRHYLEAIDGIRPHPAVGTCAAAAATGEIVVTPNFLDDRKWVELRHLPIAIGFIGAWSMPIKTVDGRVLGTFGTYYRDIREPSDVERAALRQLAAVAAAALEHARREVPGVA